MAGKFAQLADAGERRTAERAMAKFIDDIAALPKAEDLFGYFSVYPVGREDADGITIRRAADGKWSVERGGDWWSCSSMKWSENALPEVGTHQNLRAALANYDSIPPDQRRRPVEAPANALEAAADGWVIRKVTGQWVLCDPSGTVVGPADVTLLPGGAQ